MFNIEVNDLDCLWKRNVCLICHSFRSTAEFSRGKIVFHFVVSDLGFTRNKHHGKTTFGVVLHQCINLGSDAEFDASYLQENAVRNQIGNCMENCSLDCSSNCLSDPLSIYIKFSVKYGRSTLHHSKTIRL